MAKKILIMEDEKILQGILADKLKKSAYEVRVVDDGVAGMEAIAEFQPDLILLDMMMPRMGGFEVLEHMQVDDLIRSHPVIVISNSGQPVEIDRALSLGITDYIIKVDFDPVEVVAKVKQFFDSRSAQSAVSEEEEEEAVEVSAGEEGDGGLAAEVANLGVVPEIVSNGIRVLLVEDDDFLRGICEHKLKKEGFDVAISADGLDAFQQISEKEFDLVLLDVILPGMNGFDILEQVKKIPAKAQVPIIMLTNMGQESEIKRGLELGAEDYIIKAHFSVEEIIEKMRAIIAQKAIGTKEA